MKDLSDIFPGVEDEDGDTKMASRGAPVDSGGKKLTIGGLDLDALKNQLKEERIRLRDYIMKAKEEHEEKEMESNRVAEDDGDEWDDAEGYYKA